MRVASPGEDPEQGGTVSVGALVRQGCEGVLANDRVWNEEGAAAPSVDLVGGCAEAPKQLTRRGGRERPELNQGQRGGIR